MSNKLADTLHLFSLVNSSLTCLLTHGPYREPFFIFLSCLFYNPASSTPNRETAVPLVSLQMVTPYKIIKQLAAFLQCKRIYKCISVALNVVDSTWDCFFPSLLENAQNRVNGELALFGDLVRSRHVASMTSQQGSYWNGS